MQTTIDSAGRLVIPKALRQRAGLRAGMELQLEYHEGKIEIEPVRQSVRLVRRGSRLALAAPPGTRPLTNGQVNQILDEVREGRIRETTRPSR